MNYTAVDLFPDWYNQGINKEASSEELTLRRKAINKILKIDDASIWVNFLKVYLGITKQGSSEYSQIVDQVKFGDDNFLVQNENLVKILSGCAIAQKIDENTTYISDVLALAIISSELLPSVTNLITDLPNRSFRFWIKECETKREIDLKFNIGSQITSTQKIEIPELSQDAATWKVNSDAVIKSFKALQKDLNAANAEITSQQAALKAIKQNFVALSEESDVLWWLFGAYSSNYKRSFNKFTAEFLSVLIGLELGQLTKSPPGIGGIESIINKALSNVEYELGSTHSAETIINSVKEFEDFTKNLLPKEHSELQVFTPLLFAIKCRVEYAGNDWKSVYQKDSNLDLNMKFTYQNFSYQLYKELMLITVFEQAKT